VLSLVIAPCSTTLWYPQILRKKKYFSGIYFVYIRPLKCYNKNKKLEKFNRGCL
jgi:hypothetical protein